MGSSGRFARRSFAGALLCCIAGAPAQVIEYEQNGLRYQALTKGGVTVQYAQLPTHVRDYTMVQVAVSNGSQVAWVIKPEEFVFQRQDGATLRAVPPRTVVEAMLDHARRNDVIHMVSAYESALYGMNTFKSTNGYESRRQAALAEVSSAKIKAAAAASAIAFVTTKLGPGQSTDGAVFYQTAGRPLGAGRLRIQAAGELFDFENYAGAP